MCCDFSSELADVSLGGHFDPPRNRRVPEWNSLIVRTERGRQATDIEKKFFELTKDVIPTNKAKAFFKLLWNIENIKDVGQVFSSIPMIKEV
jgi:coenzyme F420-reducing hydrogenase beta subunit